MQIAMPIFALATPEDTGGNTVAVPVNSVTLAEVSFLSIMALGSAAPHPVAELPSTTLPGAASILPDLLAAELSEKGVGPVVADGGGVGPRNAEALPLEPEISLDEAGKALNANEIDLNLTEVEPTLSAPPPAISQAVPIAPELLRNMPSSPDIEVSAPASAAPGLHDNGTERAATPSGAAGTSLLPRGSALSGSERIMNHLAPAGRPTGVSQGREEAAIRARAEPIRHQATPVAVSTEQMQLGVSEDFPGVSGHGIARQGAAHSASNPFLSPAQQGAAGNLRAPHAMSEPLVPAQRIRLEPASQPLAPDPVPTPAVGGSVGPAPSMAPDVGNRIEEIGPQAESPDTSDGPARRLQPHPPSSTLSGLQAKVNLQRQGGMTGPGPETGPVAATRPALAPNSSRPVTPMKGVEPGPEGPVIPTSPPSEDLITPPHVVPQVQPLLSQGAPLLEDVWKGDVALSGEPPKPLPIAPTRVVTEPVTGMQAAVASAVATPMVTTPMMQSAPPSVETSEGRAGDGDIEVAPLEIKGGELPSTRIEALASRSDLPRHLARQVADVARMMPDRPVELTLSPEELGRLRLTFTVDGGAMAVAVNAERSDTMDLLRRHIDALAQELREIGYDEVSFDFTQGGLAQNGNEGGSTTHPFGDADGAMSPLPPDPQSAPVRLTLSQDGGIDIRL